MFDSRSTEMEFLDRSGCDPGLATASYRFMEKVNGFFGGTRVVQRFLATETAGRDDGSPLRILDIGSGSCDIPLAVSRWAGTRGIPVQFTCLETSGHAVDMARRKLALAGDPAVQLLQEDVFAYTPAEPYDYAVGSMCFHHFSDVQILALLRRLRGFVRNSVLINDLRRTPLASLGAGLLLAVTPAPAGVRHDALLSIQRGFKVKELGSLLQQLDNVTVSVLAARWFRIVAIIRYQQGTQVCMSS